MGPALEESRAQSIARGLLATRGALEAHFGSSARRDANFRRGKLALKDRELTAQRYAANAEQRLVDGPPTPSPSPPSSFARTAPAAFAAVAPPRALSSPALLKGGAGTCTSRFGASYPASHHPAPHPGALTRRRSDASLASEQTLWPARLARAPESPSEWRPPSADEGGLANSAGGATLEPLAREELAKFAAEERAFAELLRGSSSGARRGVGTGTGGLAAQRSTERLGDFMELLGPRYKTLEKSSLHRRAEEGDLGTFQRKLRREREEAAAAAQARRRLEALRKGSGPGKAPPAELPRRQRPQPLLELLEGGAEAAHRAAEARSLEVEQGTRSLRRAT